MTEMEFDIVYDLEKVKVLTSKTWKELSELIGIDYSTITRWKNGISIPSRKVMEQVYSSIFEANIRLNLIYEEYYKDQNCDDTKILFHGSKEGIKGDLCVSYSNEKRDFGKGFYLGESCKQAISFVSAYPNSCLYFIKLTNVKSLKIVEFDVCNEWMILVAYFRGRINDYSNSKYLASLLKKISTADVIVAPIADNSMYSIINEFIEGSITDLQCVNSLSANRLGKQYVVLNDKVLKENIKIMKKTFLCSREKNEYEVNKEIEKNVGKSKMILAKREYAGKGLYIEEILK